MKSLVINVLITTDRWHDGMWSMGSRSKWIGIKTIGIWLSLATTPKVETVKQRHQFLNLLDVFPEKQWNFLRRPNGNKIGSLI